VVSLLAATNDIIQRENTKALVNNGKNGVFALFGGGEIKRKKSKKTTATKLLEAEIISGCHSTSFIVNPAVLHKMAVVKIASCPANFGSL